VLSDNAGMGANYGSLGGLVGASIAAAFDSFGAARALLPPARPPARPVTPRCEYSSTPSRARPPSRCAFSCCARWPHERRARACCAQAGWCTRT
jgi:hypothetical protein